MTFEMTLHLIERVSFECRKVTDFAITTLRNRLKGARSRYFRQFQH